MTFVSSLIIWLVQFSLLTKNHMVYRFINATDNTSECRFEPLQDWNLPFSQLNHDWMLTFWLISCHLSRLRGTGSYCYNFYMKIVVIYQVKRDVSTKNFAADFLGVHYISAAYGQFGYKLIGINHIS